MELESVSFNLRKEVDSVFTLFDEKLQQKKLEVFMLVHEAVPTCVMGDPGRFRQVLYLIGLFLHPFKFLKFPKSSCEGHDTARYVLSFTHTLI